MEIVILDRQSDKLIRMEVQPRHTIGSIIETIVDNRKLDRSRKYKLTLGARSFGKENYLLRVKDARISQGDHLFLEPDAPEPRRKLEKKPPAGATEGEHISRFCLQCGKPLRANAKFCLECGASVRKG